MVLCTGFIQSVCAFEYREIGSYILSSDGNIGKVATHIKNERIVVSFRNLEKRTAHAKS
jgi:hypothetical protein